MSSSQSLLDEEYMIPLDEQFSKLSVTGVEDFCAVVHNQDPCLWRKLAIVNDDVIRKIEANNPTNPFLELINEWVHRKGSEIFVLRNHLRELGRDDFVKKLDELRQGGLPGVVVWCI